MFHKFLQGLDLSENGLAMDGIRAVAPGGHHLGTEHTMRNFRTAFYRSDLFDYNSFEQWAEEGSLTAEQKANAKYKQLLRSYEAPPLDAAVDEELMGFVRGRKATIKPEY